MIGPLPGSWLPRLLFWWAFLVSFALILVVILSPLLDDSETPSRWGKVQALFARDPFLRRTTIASAIGLIVTACIFFRPVEPTRYVLRRRWWNPRVPPPPGVAGA